MKNFGIILLILGILSGIFGPDFIGNYVEKHNSEIQGKIANNYSKTKDLYVSLALGEHRISEKNEADYKRFSRFGGIGGIVFGLFSIFLGIELEKRRV